MLLLVMMYLWLLLELLLMPPAVGFRFAHQRLRWSCSAAAIDAESMTSAHQFIAIDHKSS